RYRLPAFVRADIAEEGRDRWIKRIDRIRLRQISDRGGRFHESGDLWLGYGDGERNLAIVVGVRLPFGASVDRLTLQCDKGVRDRNQIRIAVGTLDTPRQRAGNTRRDLDRLDQRDHGRDWKRNRVRSGRLAVCGRKHRNFDLIAGIQRVPSGVTGAKLKSDSPFGPGKDVQTNGVRHLAWYADPGQPAAPSEFSVDVRNRNANIHPPVNLRDAAGNILIAAGIVAEIALQRDHGADPCALRTHRTDDRCDRVHAGRARAIDQIRTLVLAPVSRNGAIEESCPRAIIEPGVLSLAKVADFLRLQPARLIRQARGETGLRRI